MPSLVTKPEQGSVEWNGPPSTFDQFVIERVLGSGGMGHVYLARDLALDRQVALKFISAAEPSPSARGRFLVEARAIARLSHPNVVGVYRVGEVQGRPYIAYEFVPGEGFDRLAGPLPWETTLRLAVGLAAGLEAAHREGILHRDIKPSNVVLSERGDVKLLDFGLAKLAGAVDDATDMVSGEGSTQEARIVTTPAARELPPVRGATRPGTIMGTPAYLAPELWWGEPASARSDIWAFGLVLYELLLGRLPHAHLDGEEMAFAITDHDMLPVRGARPEVPESFASIIERCLRRDADERFSSALDLSKALDEVRTVFLPMSGALGAVQVEPERLAVAASLARMSTRMRPLTARLYERLFTDAPSVRMLFPHDLAAQQDKLVHALKLAIDGLADPERLAPILEDLGRRHVRYGVKIEHFDALRDALLGALADVDVDAWNTTLERGWKRAYAFIEGAMRKGMVAEHQTALSAPAMPRVRESDDTELPKTRYATSDDLSLAYQVVGDGPVDVLIMLGWLSHVEIAWQHPALAGMLRKLSRFSRVILYDKRGTGMSDRAIDSSTEEDGLKDLEAVLDAVGSKKPVIFGIAEGAATAATFASLHPERVSGLVLYGASTTSFAEAAPPHEHSPAALASAIAEIRASWGEPVFVDRDAPSMAADKAFRNWLALFMRMSASPGTAITMLKVNARRDLRSVLPAVRVPTLVLHRRGDRAVPVGAGRAFAEQIDQARFVELPGEDNLPYVGDVGALLAAVEVFTKSVAPPPPA